ncbi:hypothetical protein [Desulfurispira natronophila]|uniref:Uncharacterized protein n=1 Tax=Desulfurispira natronophila TaxID=682562 RepID=A0A7W7Y3W5_9BACT|nr:hypothetical protein [Desulfurispira natronophila]MBB5021626.1 hypothetical protein [Desulfurispira natronophila]
MRKLLHQRLALILVLGVLSLGFIIKPENRTITYESEEGFSIESAYFTASEVDDARQLAETGQLEVTGHEFSELSRETRVRPSYEWNAEEQVFELTALDVLEPPSQTVEMWRGDHRFAIALEQMFEMATRTENSLFFSSTEKVRIDEEQNYPIAYTNPLYRLEYGRFRVLVGHQTYDRMMSGDKQKIEDEYANRGISASFSVPDFEYTGSTTRYTLLHMAGQENVIDPQSGVVYHDNYRRAALIYPIAATSQPHRKFTYFIIDFYGQNQHDLTGDNLLADTSELIMSTFTPTVEQ